MDAGTYMHFNKKLECRKKKKKQLISKCHSYDIFAFFGDTSCLKDASTLDLTAPQGNGNESLISCSCIKVQNTQALNLNFVSLLLNANFRIFTP